MSETKPAGEETKHDVEYADDQAKDAVSNNQTNLASRGFLDCRRFFCNESSLSGKFLAWKELKKC